MNLQIADLQPAGTILAAASFATIGIGHVLVRRLQPIFGTRLGVPFILLGVGIMAVSTRVASDLLSGILGIVAITTFWDGIEFFRQEKRVRQGRA